MVEGLPEQGSDDALGLFLAWLSGLVAASQLGVALAIASQPRASSGDRRLEPTAPLSDLDLINFDALSA